MLDCKIFSKAGSSVSNATLSKTIFKQRALLVKQDPQSGTSWTVREAHAHRGPCHLQASCRGGSFPARYDVEV